MKVDFDYLPCGPREEAWGWHVSALGHGTIARRQPYPPPGHPADHAFSWEKGRVLSAMQVVLISAGGGTFESKEGGVQRVRPGTCFLILPGIWHRYRPTPATGWTEHWFELDGRLVGEWLREGVLETTSPVVQLRKRGALLPELRQLQETARQKAPGYRPVLAAQALGILTAVLAEAPLAEDYSHALQTSHHLLHRHVTERLPIREIARQLSLSYPTFHRQFREATGLSPKQYAEQIRQAQAEQLLASTHLSIKEIAARLHYHSAFHFSRQFKLRRGVSPLGWRQGIPRVKRDRD